MSIYIKNKERLCIDDFIFKCCIGQNGLTKKKLKVIKRHLQVFFFRTIIL